jgi:hypothetical protein
MGILKLFKKFYLAFPSFRLFWKKNRAGKFVIKSLAGPFYLQNGPAVEISGS